MSENSSGVLVRYCSVPWNWRVPHGTSVSKLGEGGSQGRLGCPWKPLEHNLAGPEQCGLTLNFALLCAGGQTRWPPEVLSHLSAFIIPWLGLEHVFPHFSLPSLLPSYLFLILFSWLRKVSPSEPPDWNWTCSSLLSQLALLWMLSQHCGHTYREVCSG